MSPLLSKERYRHELSRGRIRFSDLREVLERDLGDRAEERSPASARSWTCTWRCSSTRFGPVRPRNSSGTSPRPMPFDASGRGLLGGSRAVDRGNKALGGGDLRTGSDPSRNGSATGSPQGRVSASLKELLDRFGESTIETWSDDDWEGFTLQALWRVCCDGREGLAAVYSPLPFRRFAIATFCSRPRGGRRLARARSPDPVLRGVPGSRPGPLAAYPAVKRDSIGRSAASTVSRRSTRPLAARPGAGVGTARGSRDRASGIDPGIAGSSGRDRRGVGTVPSDTLLALRGWGGMVLQVEQRGDRAVHPIPSGSLVEFLAVRLILDRFALAYIAKDALNFRGPSGRSSGGLPCSDPKFLGLRASNSGPSSFFNWRRSSASRPTSSAG